MTIELKVPFSDKEKANSFQEYLKMKGCQSRISIESVHDEITEYSAPVGIFEQFLDKQEDENWDNEDLIGAIAEIRYWISNFRADIENIYSKLDIGIPYNFEEDLAKKICGFDPDAFEELDDDDVCIDDFTNPFHSINKLMSLTSALAVLYKNGCVSNDEDNHSVTLTQKKPIEDLVIDLSNNDDENWENEDLFSEFDPNDFSDSGIEIHFIKTIDYRYVVSLGPEIIKMNPEDIINFITDGNRFSYEFQDTIHEIDSHIYFTSYIHDLIEEGHSTIQEIHNCITEIKGDLSTSYQVSIEYLNEVLNDLKSAGLISIKNGVIKPAK